MIFLAHFDNICCVAEKKIAKLRDDAQAQLTLYYGHISYKARASKQTFFSDLAWTHDHEVDDDVADR